MVHRGGATEPTVENPHLLAGSRGSGQIGEDVFEERAPVIGGDREVVGGDAGAVEGLKAEDVAVGAVVGEDAGVGDAETLEVVGDQGGGRLLEGEVEVDRVEAVVVEEVVALGGDDGLQVGTRRPDGDQGEVVVAVDLDVELGALG